MISVGTVEQELLALPEHMSSPPVCSGVRVTRSLVLCEVVCRSLLVLLHFAVVLSVFRFTDSDYPFGVAKLFLYRLRSRRLKCYPRVPVLVPLPVLASINLVMGWFGHWYLTSRPRMTLVLHVVVFVSIVFSDVLSFVYFTQYRVRG